MKSVTFSDYEDEDSEEEQGLEKICRYRGTCGHTTDECTLLKALVKQTKEKKRKEKKHTLRKRKVTLNMR